MDLKRTVEDYLHFTFEDFLQDDYFISSTINPTKESELFWGNFQKESKGKTAKFNKAVRCINDLSKDLSGDEIEEKVWRDIQISINKRPKKNRIFYIIGAVAASIALLLFFKIFISTDVQETNVLSIKAFAEEHTTDTDASETQLILSDHKTVSLSEKESVISYDSASINISSKEAVRDEISKDESSAFNQLIVPKGKRSVLTLTDGTKIWVNSGTRLVYPVEFKKDKREIFVDGEVFLDVMPEKKRPFIVQTGNINIQVLGTKFNVQAYHSDSNNRVVLKSGKVKVFSDNNDKETILKPSDMYVLNNGTETVSQVNVNLYMSWIDGFYICEDERLDVIITRLSRYYGKEIIVSKNVAGFKCNGKLDLKNNLVDVLNIIKYISPIDFIYENDKFLITNKH
jgi:hypothetical protein